MEKRSAKDYTLLMLKGMGMGAADVVPGVSGGTIAFIVGIYDELIDSIKSINMHSLKLLFTGKITAFWKESGSGGHHRQGRACGPVIPGRAQFWG